MSKPQNRKLAAILFADIVEYTTLMQNNEQQALTNLQKFQQELETQVPSHQGKIIQFYGDGCLVVFDSAVNGVACAKKLQETFQSEPKVPVRIGLHSGDIVFKEDNVFGDAVNIASRIESIGIPGAILLSSSIRNQIKNKPEFQLVSLGKFQFKNVIEEMTVYALTNKGFPIPDTSNIKEKRKIFDSKNKFKKQKNITIAVLPFQIGIEDQRISTLFLGFIEDLISNFSKFVGLSVISSYSTLAIKDINNQTEIDKLGADYLIFGSVRSLHESLRLSVQLVNAEDQSLVFASKHDETINSLLKTQDHIVRQIVSVLQEKIDYNLLTHSYIKNSVDLAAYENYLLGMNILKKGTADGDVKARTYFNAALEINPQYSLAYTGLSLSYFNFWSCLLWNRWEISKKGAHEYALKAIEHDPNDYIALGVLGRTYVYLGEYEKAEHCLRKSLRMNSNDTTHLLRVAFSLMLIGYANEAKNLYHKAIELNPFHSTHYDAYGSNFYLESGDFETCIALSKKVNFDIWTDFSAFVAAAYFQVKDYENMWKCWEVYLIQFKKNIYSADKSLQEEALAWLKIINPYRGFSYLYPLIDYIKSEKQILPDTKTPTLEQKFSALFQLKGDIWNLRYKNESVILKDTKGLRDIHKLLSEPSKEFNCLDLMNATVDETTSTVTIDKKAKTEYMNRIQELQEDIQEAEALQLSEKAGKLQEEYDAILTHLSQSLGLSGKSRKIGSTIEKARSAVTWRIRSAIKKIKEQHPALANHLSKSIKTGTFCVYTPENQIAWEL